MQKRYRFKKGLMSIMTAISVLLVAVCFTGTIINQTGHPVINISRSTI